MNEFANKHPIATVALAVLGLYAAMYVWSMYKVGQIGTSGRQPLTSNGIATGEPNGVITASPRSWDAPISVAGGSLQLGPNEQTGSAPWDRQFS